MTEIPPTWTTMEQKVAENNSEDVVSLTNDAGILYLTGDVPSGEWLHTDGPLPEQLENRA